MGAEEEEGHGEAIKVPAAPRHQHPAALGTGKAAPGRRKAPSKGVCKEEALK